MREPALFESFNARSLEPAQVGRGFVFSSQLDEISSRSNTAIIGPRGSGKTTFLKMLTLPALHHWRSTESRRIIGNIDYVALYVPSDFTWYPDFRRPIRAAPPKALDDLLSYALFRSHVLLAICDTLQYMSDERIRNDSRLRGFTLPDDEVRIGRLCDLLADCWDLKLKIGGVFGLRAAVTGHIKHIQHLLTLSSIKHMDPEDLLKTNHELGRMFYDDLVEFANAVEHVYERRLRWAACFDEVEIAPTAVKLQAWQSGRSFDARFLIKLSASPFDSDLERLFTPTMPMDAHDYKYVVLSEQPRREVSRFSQRMFGAICAELRAHPRTAEAVLGPSFYEEEAEDSGIDEHAGSPVGVEDGLVPTSHGATLEPKRYAPTGYHFRKFQSLAEKDRSFAAYLERRSIDPKQMDRLPEVLKAADVRKIISTVVVRDEFLFESTSRKRARKRLRAKRTVPEIYTGARAIFTLCEGNPRWLIGMLRPLVKEYLNGVVVPRSGIVQRAKQADRIERTIATFLALLSTIQTPDVPRENPSIVSLIERVGDYFFEQVVGPEFNSDPVLSFHVDDGVDPATQSALGRAINQGAFVLIPDRNKARRPGEIANRRVRLTYLLAPRYRLPLVLGRPDSLSYILKSSGRGLQRKEVLADLFGGIA